MPREVEAAILVVLHRPIGHVSHLREVLSRVSSMPVVIAKMGGRFLAGTCYIGEPSEHLTLAANGEIHLVSGAHGEYRNRTVDLLFASVALQAKERAVGVVLAGSLDDGSRGLAAIRHAGGTTMVVASDYSPVKGMPENARLHAQPVHVVGTTLQIATAIVAHTQRRHSSWELSTA
jgi:two-component system, chemotaxis family, protein-glutamate methylesterase/glutaminase